METVFTFAFIFLVVIVPFGLVGNMLSFVTWSVGKRCRHLSASFYFKPLAVVDTFILLVPAMDYLLAISPFHGGLSNMNDVLCTIIPFLTYTTSALSMWVTAALSIEKTCSLFMPFKFTNQSVKKRIYITVAILTLVASVVNISYLTDYKILDKDGIVYCTYPKGSFSDTYGTFFVWFDILSVYTVPFIILIICNVMILVKMFKRSHNAIGNPNDEVQSRRQTQLKYTTYQVVAICVIHFVTTIPYSVVFIIQAFNDSILARKLFLVFYAIRYLNNAINFVLYCVIGSDFRQDFKDLFACCCCRRI